MLPMLMVMTLLSTVIRVDGFVLPLGARLLFSIHQGKVSNQRIPQQLSALIEYDDDLLPSPHPEFDAIDVVHLCMKKLMNSNKFNNDSNDGLKVCFSFSSDFLQAPFGGQLDAFVQHAKNPVFASLVHCTHFEILSIGPIIPGTNTRGAMQTCLMAVQSPSNEERRFLWTLQKERRPPRQHCWLVHEVLFVKNAYQLTL